MLIQNTSGIYWLAKEIVEKRASQAEKSVKQPGRK